MFCLGIVEMMLELKLKLTGFDPVENSIRREREGFFFSHWMLELRKLFFSECKLCKRALTFYLNIKNAWGPFYEHDLSQTRPLINYPFVNRYVGHLYLSLSWNIIVHFTWPTSTHNKDSSLSANLFLSPETACRLFKYPIIQSVYL